MYITLNSLEDEMAVSCEYAGGLTSMLSAIPVSKMNRYAEAIPVGTPAYLYGPRLLQQPKA